MIGKTCMVMCLLLHLMNIDISQLQDPLKKARDVKDIGHYSHGDTEVVISERGEIPYALSLIKQVYERN